MHYANIWKLINKGDFMNNRMLVVILFAVVFCTEFISIGFGSEDRVSSSLSSPITANLSISKIPLINETTNLYCRVVAYSDAPNTTTEITLPEGIELVSGHLTGQWDLEADVPVYLNVTIKFSKTGDFKIQAIARRVIDEKTFWGDIANIYLTVGNKSSYFTPPPIWAYYPAIQISPGKAQRVEITSEIIPIDPHTLPQSNELPVSSKNLSTITGSTNPGALIITGRWYYWGQDSNYKTTPNAWLPAKSFLVGIVKASDNTFLGMGYTNENGAFSIPITNPGSDGFKVSLWIYNQYPNGEEMRVIMDTAYTGLEGLTGVYGWTTGKITSADGTFDVGGISLPTTDNKYRACWLLNDLNRANRYFSSHSGGVASQGTIAWWPENTGVNGKGNAVYTWGGQINIPGGLEVSSHVVMHEYGHNIMYRRYGNYMPYSSLCNCETCTTHYWDQCYDEECGWTEGWADFFCCCPDNDPVYKDPRFSSIDFESATPGNGWCTGPSCEARVCGALWDIFDTENDGLDTYGWGFGPIANVFIGGKQNTFADFWAQWQSKVYPTDASYCLLQNTIDPGINKPTVTNDGPASGIGASVATVGAQITNTGGANPELHIVWGTSDASTTIGSWQHNENLGTNGLGTYYRDLAPLTPGTTYYYRSYATNSAGTGWASSTATFTTTCTNECTSGAKQCSGSGYQTCGDYDSDGCTEWSSVTNCPTGQSCSNGQCVSNTVPPTVTNDGPASGIGSSVATVGAQITNTGGMNPELHIVWGTSDAGTTIGSWQHNENLGTNGLGTYYRDLAPLTPGTTYYYRSYATNSAGTDWASSTATFSTPIIPPVSGWDPLGGYVTSSPSIVVDNAGKTETWVRGWDNALWVNIDGAWHGKGGVLSSDPFAVKDYNGKIHVLVRGGDNSVWDFIYDSIAATGHWKGLGGYITEAPTATMDPTKYGGISSIPNIMRIAANGGDNALWTCDLDINTEACTWKYQGGILTSRPYIISDPTWGKEHIFVRGGDNQLWDCYGYWTGSTWARTWMPLGGYLANGPIAAVEPGVISHAAVFVKGGDSALWMCDVNSANSPETGSWYGFGGVISSDPFAVADTSANKIHVFVRGGDSALWENIFTTSPWSPNGNQWQGIGGSILTYTPGAAIGSNTQTFVIGTDNALWRNTHTTFSAASSGGDSSLKREGPNQVNYPTGDPNSAGGKS
jgi:hypothetical protein